MQLFNHTRKLLLNSEVTFGALKVMLYGDSYTFNAAETDMETVEAQEVHGNGWTQGGEAIASAAVTLDNTNEAMLDGVDISKTATGGDIGPAKGMVVFDSTGSNSGDWVPLFNYTFPSPLTALEGVPFLVSWASAGIARANAPS